YTKESVLAHHKKWYIPNNATLIVVGDIDEQETIKLVQRYFGYIRPGTLPNRARPQELDHKGVTISLVQKNQRNANIVMFFNYRIPAYRLLPKGHFNALTILEHILSAQETSPLYKEFVHNRQAVLSVGLSCAQLSIDDRYASLNATLAPHHCPKKFKNSVFKWVHDFVNNKLSVEDIQQARKEIVNQKVFISDEPTSIREDFSALAFGVSVEDIIHQDRDLETVTLQDIKDVYNTYLNKKADVCVMILPEKEQPKKSTPPATNNKQEKSTWVAIKEGIQATFTKW
ncbi:MAG: insulinase family protein, partial [Alphaproteobacteria bacterium]|nr:insulinase family protein [Alphaproteobacteria bacterium]